MSEVAYRKLLDYLRETALLASCSKVLGWDQETCMPARAAELRARQLALLAGLVHRRRCSRRLLRLLDQARPFAGARGADSPEAANVREAQRDYDLATRVPAKLAEERARLGTLARRYWVEARQASDFALFRPWLEKIVALMRRYADAIGYDQHPYDALLEEYEPGETTAGLRAVFGPLQQALVALVARLQENGAPPDTTCLEGTFPAPAQRAFAKAASASLGFDYDRGRLDDTVHPFCSAIGPDDVRLTSRWDERVLADGFLSALHEAGHGMYEQGLAPEHFGAPLGQACSHGVHESQSRLWENFVGRSRGFWSHFLPRAQKAFPGELAGVTPEACFRAVNVVQPSLIRVDADEVTYNLHIFLRFELEQELIAGTLRVKDVPAAWNDRFEAAFRIRPAGDAQGCLQDIHWSAGYFGYFPTYTLGNVYAAQLHAQAQAELGDLDAAFGRGEFAPLHRWLGEKVYRHGRRYRPRELVEQATGRPPSAEPLVRHLEAKYGAVYGL